MALGGIAVSYERGTPVTQQADANQHLTKSTRIAGSDEPSGSRRQVQEYRAHKTPPPPWDPLVALCLGNYGDPGRVGVSCERGTPVMEHANVNQHLTKSIRIAGSDECSGQLDREPVVRQLKKLTLSGHSSSRC